MVYLLAKAGWYNGNPSAIYSAPVDDVVNAYHYEIFTRQYEMADFELNKQ